MYSAAHVQWKMDQIFTVISEANFIYLCVNNTYLLFPLKQAMEHKMVPNPIFKAPVDFCDLSEKSY
jgi:hypothetical protein